MIYFNKVVNVNHYKIWDLKLQNDNRKPFDGVRSDITIF